LNPDHGLPVTNWYSTRSSSGRGKAPADTRAGGGAPDIVFEGTGTNGKLTVKDSLNPPTPTSKPKRPYRRVCSASNSRIIGWALVNSAGAVIKDPVIGRELKDSGDDSYYFYISFHPHPLP